MVVMKLEVGTYLLIKHLLTYYYYIDDSDQSADSSTSVFFLPKTTSKFLELSPLKLILRDIWNRGVILGGRSTCGILRGRPVWHVAEADHMYAKCPPVCHLASTHNHLLHPLMGVHCSIVTHHLTLQAVKQTQNHQHHRLEKFVCIKLNVEEDEAHARKKSRYEGSCSLNLMRSSWICVVLTLSSSCCEWFVNNLLSGNQYVKCNTWMPSWAIGGLILDEVYGMRSKLTLCSMCINSRSADHEVCSGLGVHKDARDWWSCYLQSVLDYVR